MSVSRWDGLDLGGVLQDEVDGITVHRVKLPAGPSLRRNMLFRNAVIRHLGMSRATVAQFLTLEPLRTSSVADLKRTGVRGLFTGTLLSTFSKNPAKRMLQRQWIRVPIERLDHVVVSSLAMRDFYASLGVTTPMSIIPNGVDLQRFRSPDPVGDKKLARDALGIPATAHVLVFVGSIVHRKGVDLLLDAFARVAAADPLAELVLVGPRDNHARAREFNAQIDSLVAGSGAARRIRFVGYVPRVDEYLRAADVFVLPSRREGMGNVVLEAMATGIPTVLTPYLGLPAEFGKPGRQYVLSAPDADSLAVHIQSLLRDGERLQAIAEEGQRWVSDHMSMSVAVEAYARIYRDLALYGGVRSQNQAVSWIE